MQQNLFLTCEYTPPCKGQLQRSLRITVHCSLPSSPTQFGSLPALIAAAVSLSDVDSVRDSADSSVNDSDSSFSSTGDEDVDVTRSEVRGSAGFVIGFAALALLLSLLWIIIRFCNIGLVNLKVKIFLIIVS